MENLEAPIVTKLGLRPSLFWDADIMQIDPDRDRVAIVHRIMEYGKWVEIQQMVHYYGHRGVVDILEAHPLNCSDPKSNNFSRILVKNIKDGLSS